MNNIYLLFKNKNPIFSCEEKTNKNKWTNVRQEREGSGVACRHWETRMGGPLQACESRFFMTGVVTDSTRINHVICNCANFPLFYWLPYKYPFHVHYFRSTKFPYHLIVIARGGNLWERACKISHGLKFIQPGWGHTTQF